ncbi:MAG: hypothetical protein A2622_10840 [Bdellovibrionales bacterium RIFCSPHIGHO2_01_FULL_40_29]|nr:MAG: hypothetical protein A2622_10840 [Bdellovibrionales bacterium RIFCSPHIGHO2_01_FULL_40_29]OFZ34452.1 MAG: hypothetical protein A3D17_01105 [Bdellovibrionales bacterium RIFCSPHIGHO2_02_FULL_40_15]
MNLEIISHTPESLLLLPQNRQEILIKLATLISALESDKPFRNKQSLMNIMSQCGLHLDSEVFEKLEDGDSIEAWTSDPRFLFAMGDFIHRTNYSYHDLATNDWAELFHRDELIQKRILRSLQTCIATNKIQENIADWHLVSEMKTEERASCYIKIKMLAPFHGENISGVIAIVKSKEVPGIRQKLIRFANSIKTTKSARALKKTLDQSL